jgi:predicted TIM-barrel fold metal-dependent hydrolase
MWDCHAHAFGPVDRYNLAPARGYDPPVTSLDAYHAQARAAGIGHTVFVQPSVYGDDNAALLDALAAGQGAHRAVIAVGADVTQAELPALHALGVRGVRLTWPSPDPAMPARIVSLMPALHAQGWHVAANLDTTAPGALARLLDWIGVPVVVDHFGRPPIGTTDPAALAALLGAVEAGRVWVKLSSPYQVTAASYTVLTPIARALHWARPEATLFASNWPHIGAPDPAAVPNIDALIGIAADWLGLPRHQAITLFEGNAHALYA